MKNKFLLSIIFMLGAGLSHGQSLQELIKKAIDYAPMIKSQGLNLKIQEQKKELTNRWYYPTVTGTASYQRVGPVSTVTFPLPTGAQEFKFQPYDNYNASLNVNSTLWDFGRTQASLDKISAETAETLDGITVQEHTLAYQISSLFNAAVYYQKSIAVQEKEIEQLRKLREVTQTLVNNGTAIDYDVLSIDVRINNSQNRKTDLTNAYRKQLIIMRNLTGMTDNPVIGDTAHLDYPKVLPPVKDWYSDKLKDHPEMKLAGDKIVAAEKEVAIVKLADRPTLQFGGSAGFRDGFMPDLNAPVFNYAAGVQFSMPLYTGGRTKINTEMAAIAVQMSKYQQEATRMNLIRDIETNISEMQDLLEKYTTLETQVKMAKEALDLANSRYKLGVVRNIEVFDAQTNLTLIELTRLQYEFQLSQSWIDIKRLTGVKIN